MEFTVQRNLLNPMFEGYKLDAIDQEKVVSRFPLPEALSQEIASRSPLSFPEVQSRIYHNHLYTGQGRCVYIDSASQVVLVDMDRDTLEPRFNVVYELPQTITSASATSDMHPEFPVALFASPNVLLVSDGRGSVHVLQLDPENKPSAEPEVYNLATEDASQHPFRLHEATLTPEGHVLAIVSFRCYGAQSQPATSGKKTPPTFEVRGVSIGPSPSTEEPRTLATVFRRRGDFVPTYVRYDPIRHLVLLAGGSVYKSLEAPPTPHYEPKPDELAPIPRAGENLDGPSDASDAPPRPPPYSWYQTPDALTVVFALPPTTTKRDIHVAFTSTTLTLSIDNVPSSTPLHPPTYSSARLWDKIRPETTYWTWDSEDGLLTLTLDKAEENRNWMHVFQSAEQPSSDAQRWEDAEVPETRDPSELAGIRDALEKYTAEVGGGLGHGVPSLGEGEMDMEIDSAVGREVCVTWASTAEGASDTSSAPVQLLSTDIPSAEAHMPSFVIKNALDGAEFSLNINGNGPQWTHVGTFSALSFVLASKQDTRFTFHVPGRAAMAFESGTRDRGSNVYIYRAAEGKAVWSKQAILKVAEGGSGSLLGVGLVDTPKHGPVILCLTEKELVLLKNVL
ncbi:hypothetical protein EV714DRAFT_214806 [Schizophyllum commune]